MDLAAPASPNFCDKCFAVIEDAAEFCTDCGAPVGSAKTLDGDAALMPELARANLMRMRGEYKEAEDVCLAILRRYPNQATTNTLLGDISAECGDLDQAVQWYELALDLVPDSAVDQRKLASVRQRQKEHEAASSIANLELPSKPSLGPMLITLGLAVIAVVGVVSFVLGRQIQRAELPKGPIVLRPGPKEPSATIIDEPKPEPKTDEPAPAGEMPSLPWRTQADAALTAELAKKSPEGPNLLDASLDPRKNGLRLTFLAAASSSERNIAAKLAAAAFDHLPETSLIVLRGLRGNELVYVTTASREGYASTKSDAWQTENKDKEGALADAMLTDEWRAGSG